MVLYANGALAGQDFSATIDDACAHFSIPPMGDRGAILITLPLDPPKHPDWDLYRQLIAVEECLNGEKYTQPPLPGSSY